MLAFILGCSSSSKKDNDTQPIKSGTIADLDEEAAERTEDNSQTGKTSTDTTTQVSVFLNIVF